MQEIQLGIKCDDSDESSISGPALEEDEQWQAQNPNAPQGANATSMLEGTVNMPQLHFEDPNAPPIMNPLTYGDPLFDPLGQPMLANGMMPMPGTLPTYERMPEGQMPVFEDPTAPPCMNPYVTDEIFLLIL